MPVVPYGMSPGPHIRRHGPAGYTEYGSYKDWLRDEFQFRCVFCLEREKWDRRGWRRFHIDHIIPQSIHKTKIALYDNLLYVCDSCNEYKSNWVLPDPCRVAFGQHSLFRPDGTVTPLSDFGRMWIDILRLNIPRIVNYRRKWLAMLEEFTQACMELDEPDLTEALAEWFGYPDDIPDLRRLRPTSNSKPGSEHQCYYVWLENGQIPPIY
jgi:hypothetical protein